MKQPIASWKSWLRKGDTIRSVSQEAVRLDQDQFFQRLSEIQSAAAASLDPLLKTRSFWQMEKISAEFFKSGNRSTGLHDDRLPLEVRPIAHCGMGIGAVEMLGFEIGPLLEAIDRFSHPDYRLFAWESIGAMLGVYEPGPFLQLARGMRRLGLIPMANLERPVMAPYLEHFDPDCRKLLAHGFGRLTYFRSHSVPGALQAVRGTPLLDYASCVRGIAFAMAMVNSRDVARVIDHHYECRDEDTDCAFEAGLVYALVFWEWMSPGFLEQMAPKTGFGRKRMAAARCEIELSRERGYPTAFTLSHAPPASRR